MKTGCALAAVLLIIAFTAVNLFIPYGLLILAMGIGLAVFVGVPCGLLTRGRKDECRLGYC